MEKVRWPVFTVHGVVSNTAEFFCTCWSFSVCLVFFCSYYPSYLIIILT